MIFAGSCRTALRPVPLPKVLHKPRSRLLHDDDERDGKSSSQGGHQDHEKPSLRNRQNGMTVSKGEVLLNPTPKILSKDKTQEEGCRPLLQLQLLNTASFKMGSSSDDGMQHLSSGSHHESTERSGHETACWQETFGRKAMNIFKAAVARTPESKLPIAGWASTNFLTMGTVP